MGQLSGTVDTLEGLGLSAREREVFWLVAERLRNREIADRLHIGLRTVESHVSTILRKVGGEQRDDIISLASTMGRRRIRATAPPAPLSSFIGRDAEAAELLDLVGHERLITVVGPPGVGKTRLAFHIARTARDMPPPVLVDLATAASDEDLLRVFAGALGITEAETGLRSVLSDVVAAGPAWLILDNCEHVEDEVAALTRDLFAGAPDLHVLATSRSPIGIDGERVFILEPLDVLSEAHGIDAALDASACRLFLDRSRPALAAEGNGADVVALCRRLDGLPLAIELAAAQTRWFSPAELLAQLDDHLIGMDARRTDLADRHRTIAAAVQWSYDLLDVDERSLLERCAVFPGWFELDVLVDVAAFGNLDGDDVIRLLPRLVDRSLVVARQLPDQPTAYRMLESIRAFARSRLFESGAREVVYERHARCHLEGAVALSPELTSRGQASAIAWFQRRWGDLSTAMQWALAHNDVEAAWTFICGVGRRWLVVGPRGEVLDWIERLLDRDLPANDLGVAARLTAAHLLCFKDTDRAFALVREARAVLDGQDAALVAQCDLTTGKVLAFLARHDEARPCLERAVKAFRLSGDLWHEALALQTFGHGGGDTEDAFAHYRRSARRFRELHDEVMLANTLVLMSARALAVDPDLPDIDEWNAESRVLAERTDNQVEQAHVALNEALLKLHRGDHAGADEAFSRLVTTFRGFGDQRCTARCLVAIGQIAVDHGKNEAAVVPLRAAAGITERVTFPVGLAAALRLLAVIDERAGDYEQAARLLGRADAAADKLEAGRRDGLPDDAQLRARLAERLGDDLPRLMDEGRRAPSLPW